MAVRKRILRPLMMAAAISTPAANAEGDLGAFWTGQPQGRGMLAHTLQEILADPSLPAAHARDWKVPRSLVVGILMQETHSTLSVGDVVTWVDRKRGKDGERGPTQITPGAFADHALPGERFGDLERDMAFALDMTERILLDHRKALGSWEKAVRAYNAGRGNWRSKAGARYHADVVKKGKVP